MSERNRQLSFPRYSAMKCERRPVTKEDKWCRQTMPAGCKVEDDAPMGDIVTIYAWKWPEKLYLCNLGGTIVRSKMCAHTLMLQVVKNDKAPHYCLTSNRINSTKKLINIRKI